MKKITRSDIPKFADGNLNRSARCGLVYTPAEYDIICAGHIAEDMTDLFHIFEEEGELFIVDRSEGKLAYKAAFERRGTSWILAQIFLEDDASSREVFPGDIDAARMVWMIIEERLLRRFPQAAWQAHMEGFRMTPEVDDPSVPMTAHERAFIFAGRAFFKKHARFE